ncbi:MAG TPA: MurT ligase domain-containing protein [Acidimicrobiales bacterium]|nr:MurT ligase domain-containing protein [Acidimicrobiales bacterium]
MPEATAGVASRPGRLPLRTRGAARAGSAVSAVSRRIGAGSGGVIGGRVSLAIDPSALERLAVGHRVVLVSGTNGKTTTTRLLSTAVVTTHPVVTNLGGANLPPGLVAALSTAEPGSVAVLEVDEAYLGRVAAAVRPVGVCLLNLSRDQLDRMSEVRMLAARWRQAVGGLTDATVVANADDPLVAWAALAAPTVVWVAAGASWKLDASGCPECEGTIAFDADTWACPTCGLSRPDPQVWLEGSELVTTGGRRVPLQLGLPGRANRANAAMAATAATILGVDEARAAEAMAAVSEVTGRYRVVRVGGRSCRLLLSKNPAGWMEIFDILSPPPAPVVVAINARVADGRDPSWLWDVPFERLAGRRLVVATGERCRDLGVRLRYAEVDHVTVPDLTEAVRAGSDASGGSSEGVVDVVANYTSFQQLRALSSDG